MSSAVNGPAAIEPLRPRGFVLSGFLVAVLLLTSSVLVAAYWQQEWEFPLVRAVNAYAGHSMLLDRSLHALTARDLLQGVPMISLIWFLWFASDDAKSRAKLLVGTLAASVAGMLSRIIQLGLPTHLRPLHQPQLGFVLPFGVEPETLNHFNSFPSDHGAVFFTLCAVIWRANPRLGIAALTWAVIVDFARVYEGYHFPSDVIGSMGLGFMVLYLCQAANDARLVSRIVALAQRRPDWFYMTAFVLTYLIATLFDDVRKIAGGFAAVALHHDVFGGS